jgi:hypothetical protein
LFPLPALFSVTACGVLAHEARLASLFARPTFTPIAVEPVSIQLFEQIVLCASMFERAICPQQNEGAFVGGHPWHRVDWEASNVYRSQEYNDEMSARMIRVRGKICELTQSRKLRADTFELAALALALRVTKAQKLVEITEATLADIALLVSKIETYRKRAKRSATARVGPAEYRSLADMWRGHVEWIRYNVLYTKLPKNRKAWRAQCWREQRQQMAQAIRTALAARFYEIPADQHMDRMATLITTSLRRCRYSAGLREVLEQPQAHTDYLISFVSKRIDLNRLPDAPATASKAMGQRADPCENGEQSGLQNGAQPANVGSAVPVAIEHGQKLAAPAKATMPRRYTHNRQPVTAAVLVDAMAEWLYEAVTINFEFTRDIYEEARFQIQTGCIDYRKTTCATSVKGLINELCPVEFSDDAQTLIGQYADWLLAVLVAVHPEPRWIYQAIEPICGRALKRKEETRYDESTSKRLYRSPRESLGA